MNINSITSNIEAGLIALFSSQLNPNPSYLSLKYPTQIPNCIVEITAKAVIERFEPLHPTYKLELIPSFFFEHVKIKVTSKTELIDNKKELTDKQLIDNKKHSNDNKKQLKNELNDNKKQSNNGKKLNRKINISNQKNKGKNIVNIKNSKKCEEKYPKPHQDKIPSANNRVKADETKIDIGNKTPAWKTDTQLTTSPKVGQTRKLDKSMVIYQNTQDNHILLHLIISPL